MVSSEHSMDKAKDLELDRRRLDRNRPFLRICPGTKPHSVGTPLREDNICRLVEETDAKSHLQIVVPGIYKSLSRFNAPVYLCIPDIERLAIWGYKFEHYWSLHCLAHQPYSRTQKRTSWEACSRTPGCD